MKFYPKEEFNRLRKAYGAKFTGPLMEWRKTPEGKKIFDAQMAAHHAKGDKGSQTSKKRKGEFDGMSRKQVKQFKAAKAKAEFYESEDYTRKIFSTFGGSSTANSSGGSSSPANSSSGNRAPQTYADFEMVLKSIQKDGCEKQKN